MDAPQEKGIIDRKSSNPIEDGMDISTTFQIMSDLHLEFGSGYESFHIPPCAPYLCLLGDIGRAVDEKLFIFLEHQLGAFKVVFFVLGNHEPYGSSYPVSKERFAAFRDYCEQKRIIDPATTLPRKSLFLGAHFIPMYLQSNMSMLALV
jgi:hypothetical protein